MYIFLAPKNNHASLFPIKEEAQDLTHSLPDFYLGTNSIFFLLQLAIFYVHKIREMILESACRTKLASNETRPYI